MFIGIPAAFLLCACGKQADTSATKTAPKVVYTKPVVRDIVLWDDYTAKIEAIASVNIRAQVGGYLKSINFKEGENVKKGDLLFVIDPRPYEAALASAEAELAEAKARVELAKTNLERAKELYAADVVAKELLDTRNCEMLSSNAAKNRIALLCGRSATDFELKCAPLTDSLPNIPKVFPSQLLERRPDIAAAERNVYAANAQLGADTAAFFPTISITGDVGFKANRIENLLEAGSLAWGISPQLYIPIFQAGKLCAQKDADIAAHKEATEKYKSTVLGAIEEVETLFSDISHMNREYENRRQTSAHSADVQMYTQKQYELGDQDYFAVSDAQRQYLTYKREEIRLLGARYRSYVSLVMSLGGGWENKYENPSAFELVNL